MADFDDQVAGLLVRAQAASHEAQVRLLSRQVWVPRAEWDLAGLRAAMATVLRELAAEDPDAEDLLVLAERIEASDVR